MARRVLISWSSGKDCAWALHVLRRQPGVEIVGLFSTVNEVFDRVSTHAVRTRMLREQAAGLGLPIEVIYLPHPCSGAQYQRLMDRFFAAAESRGIDAIAFGDLFREDIRAYREGCLAHTDIEALFPLWGSDTYELARRMVTGGLRAWITCLDPRCIPTDLAGSEYSEAFLRALPARVDPCGEYGEFHSFAFDGPMFEHPLSGVCGDVVFRNGLVLADIRAA